MGGSNKVRCEVTGELVALGSATPIELIRPSLLHELRYSTRKELPHSGFVSNDVLNRARSEYLARLFEQEEGDLRRLNEEVAKSILNRGLLTSMDDEGEPTPSFGQQMADRIAHFAGSWPFIISFLCVLAAWITLNLLLAVRAFDPFPFILLNLVLSCIAAIQAPLIMMSQNRQEAKDRQRSENDYKVNRKAELEIQHLHDKLDVLTHNLWSHLLEIQETQLEVLREMSARRRAQ